jgi:hypothetical protein
MTAEVKTKRARKSNSFVSVNNSWLGMRFEERELYNKEPDEASISRLEDLLEGDV